MKQKHLVVGVLVLLIMGLAIYIAWPEEKSSQVSVTGRLMDRMVDKLPFTKNTVVDKRTVINGRKVPPVPSAAENAKTIRGVDSDENGIRDDIDRKIAEDFGNDPKYQDVVYYIKSVEYAMEYPTKDNAKRADQDAACAAPINGSKETEQVLRRLIPLNIALLNNRSRQLAYNKAFAGTELESCPRNLDRN